MKTFAEIIALLIVLAVVIAALHHRTTQEEMEARRRAEARLDYLVHAAGDYLDPSLTPGGATK